LTETTTTSRPNARVTIAAAPTLAAAVSALPLDVGGRSCLVLPASLRRSDVLAAAVRERLRQDQVENHLLIPANPVAELARFTSRGAKSPWEEAEVALPDGESRQVRLPAKLWTGAEIWTATDVDAVSGSGPFVLDVLSRYLHPASRLRHLTTRHRADAAVEVNLAVRVDRAVIAMDFGEFVLVCTTTDLIAGELVALALSDEHATSERSLTGPWEERVVQRATELDLGVQVPQQIEVDLQGAQLGAFAAAIPRILSRIGVHAS